MRIVSLTFVALCIACYGRHPGFSPTPPMGFNSWQRFRCNTDCQNYPDYCISEKLYMEIADRMAKDGYKDAGYKFVNVDDCWPLKSRDSTTHQQVPDPQRFPSGISGLAKYVHSLGLKMGLYSDIGTRTCGGYPGMQGYFALDSQTFAGWGIDYLKVDGCYESTSVMNVTYPQLSKALLKTNRSIVYSCSWPAYLHDHGEDGALNQISANCDLWRNYNDIQDDWDSISGIIAYWRRNPFTDAAKPFFSAQGPSSFNDPDMLIIGDNGLSISEQQIQMAIWAIIAAPLLISADLRTISNESKAILLNKEVIAINQDPLGKQGGAISYEGGVTIWVRELADKKSIAVVLQYESNGGSGKIVTFSPGNVPLNQWTSKSVYVARDLFNHSNGAPQAGDLSVHVPPHSCRMFKLTLQS